MSFSNINWETRLQELDPSKIKFLLNHLLSVDSPRSHMYHLAQTAFDLIEASPEVPGNIKEEVFTLQLMYQLLFNLEDELVEDAA